MRKDTCIHFNGLVPHDVCDAGVSYLALAGAEQGMALRLPCSGGFPRKEGTPVAVCLHKRLPTAEEIEADKAEVAALINQFQKAGPLIDRLKREFRGVSANGVEACPACETGRLRWRIAGSNGHVAAKCSNDGCLSFIE